MNPIVLLFYIIPKNLLSRLIGSLVQVRLPHDAQNWLNRRFVQLFKIDMSEAEKNLEAYPTIQAVFTRALKPGSRSFNGPFCSPCDGTLSIADALDADTAIQAKGFYYDASELTTGTKRLAHTSKLRHFLTIYLAPHNYHRVHAPVAGTIRNIYYLPGELWPVNQLAIHNVPRVFTRNERLSFEIEAANGGKCYVVMVGALNVGRISSPLLPDFYSNAKYFSPGRFRHFELGDVANIQVGDELGTFMLGSTVVLVMDEEFMKHYTPISTQNARKIVLGESIQS